MGYQYSLTKEMLTHDIFLTTTRHKWKVCRSYTMTPDCILGEIRGQTNDSRREGVTDVAKV